MNDARLVPHSPTYHRPNARRHDSLRGGATPGETQDAGRSEVPRSFWLGMASRMRQELCEYALNLLGRILLR
jgi:hypothetical protein